MGSRADARRRASARVRRRRRLAAALTVVVALVVAGGAGWFALSNASPAPETRATVAPETRQEVAPDSPTEPPAESAEPLGATEQLLASANDPTDCVVSFAGDGIDLAPHRQPQGALYAGLPIPRADGRVFAGWYTSETDAEALRIAGRVNGSELAACTDRQVTLHGAWTTPEANAAESAGIPILMYHQFTTNPAGEGHALRLNYAYIDDFDAQMAYIAESGFYLPTWDELDAFIDGALFLPKHSVIVTDDDAHSSWLELAAPIVHEHGVLTTSFVITKWRSEGAPNPYVLQRSHTHDMHDPGANGDGRMVNWTADEIAADLETSARVLGAKQVIAYPFGHFDDTAKEGVAQAGFALARTIEQGYVRIGTDKLALPCIRIDYGMGVDALQELIG